MKGFRWLFLAGAVVLIVQTPWAVVDIIPYGTAKPSLVVMLLVIGLPLRTFLIWWFFHRWWKLGSAAITESK